MEPTLAHLVKRTDERQSKMTIKEKNDPQAPKARIEYDSIQNL
jgi:hypothetical protein